MQWIALAALATDDIRVLLAPRATPADIADISPLILRAIRTPETLTESERLAVLALPPSCDVVPAWRAKAAP